MEAEDDAARKRRRLNPPETGPYVLRSLAADIPLAAEETEHEIQIHCVEFWSKEIYPLSFYVE